jgi:hypothetical protein
MNPPWLKEKSNPSEHWLEIALHCQPGAKTTQIQGEYAERLKVRIASAPVEGKANEALTKWFAKILLLGASSVELISGESSKQKRLKIKSMRADDFLRLIEWPQAPSHRC